MKIGSVPPDVRYVIVGTITSALSLSLLGFFVEVLGLDEIAANIAQGAITTFVNYLLICSWVYYANPWSVTLASANFGARASMFCFVQALSASFIMAGVPYVAAYLVSSSAGFVGNFLLAKYVVFRSQRKKVM